MITLNYKVPDNFIAKYPQEKNIKFRVGDVIEFNGGYYNDIRYSATIVAIDMEDLYLSWECYWFPIQDTKERNILFRK